MHHKHLTIHLLLAYKGITMNNNNTPTTPPQPGDDGFWDHHRSKLPPTQGPK